MKKSKRTRKLALAAAVTMLAVTLCSQILPVVASSSLPWTGSQQHGVNEPSVRGYTAQQIIDWTPEEQPYAELLRSHVPLQNRIDAFSDTQANPNLNPDVQMLSVMGDYGDSFMDNPAYTDKFGVYTFNYWQYVDYISYWHGTATAYEDRELYDPTDDWKNRWFEIGCLNIPNPAWTDAAHKNGVLSLAQMFFSDNDRGMLTYKQMLVKDEDGSFPVAEKLIEIANYYGFDGYFFNQEEGGNSSVSGSSIDVAPEDFADYRAFMARLVEGGLYINWYDAVGSSGNTSFAKNISNGNVDWLYDRSTGKLVSNSFFFDYAYRSAPAANLQTYLDTINSQYGTDFTAYEVGFAGVEAGRDKFKSAQTNYLPYQINPETGYPYTSIAMLGADFVHHELDSDMGHSDQGLADVALRYDNDYQWMSTVRERLWWSGPQIDPTNTTRPSSQTSVGKAVYADNANWAGVASFITERSVMGDANFYTNFNTGRGLRWYRDGVANNEEEWSNISIQDIPVTWQWWQDTAGSDLTFDYDYGQGYGLGNGEIFDYEQIGGYNGGSSLVANGTLDAENFLHLYKTEIALNSNHELELVYHKPSSSDSSSMSLGLILQSDPDTVVKVPLTGGGMTTGWETVTADLSAYAGEIIAAFGLVFDPGADGSIADWQMNIGSITVADGSAVTPSAPSGLKIQEAFEGTGEMYLEWNLDHSYDQVNKYNIYVNDVYVGGKYDEVYYIKHLPANSGTISVVPVGADGREGTAATLNFDLNSAGVSNLTAASYDDGEFIVNWNTAGASGNVTVEVETRWHLMGEPVYQTTTVSARSGAAIFTDMPTNGDNFIVRLHKDGQDSLSITGSFVDVEIEPYAEEWSWEGNTLNLPMATTRDWRYMWIYEDGNLRKFTVTYYASNFDGIIRGRSSKKCLSFDSTADMVWIIMEDYSGNQSEPVYLRAPAVDEALFPDPVLRQWVLDNVGDTAVEVMNYTGELELSDLDIHDFTGLTNFINAKVLSAAGNRNITTFSDLNAPESIEQVDVSATSIETVTAREVEAYQSLTTLDITGADKLMLLDMSGSSLRVLNAGEASDLEELFYVDLRNTALDVSEGADTRIFADWIDLNKTDRTKSYAIAKQGNLALEATVSGVSNSQNLNDGNTSTSASVSVGESFIMDLGAATTIENIGLQFTSTTYRATSLTYNISDDGENWETLGTVNNSSNNHTYTVDTDKTPRYVKVTVNNTYYGSYGYPATISEVTVNGSQNIIYLSAVYYDGQTQPDPSALQALYERAARYDRNDYTPSTWVSVQEALDTVQEALAYTDPAITKREIAECSALLQTATEGLVLAGNADVLYDWAGFIWNLYKDRAESYSAASWNNFVDAVQHALDIAAAQGEELTLTEYEAAYNGVNGAIASLVKQNKASLYDWIVMAEAVLTDAGQNGGYFESSVTNITAVLDRAYILWEDENATQTNIDAMVIELQNALEEMLRHGNRRNLDLLITLAETLTEQDYMSDGWAVCSKALAAAKELTAGAELTQNQLDNAYNALLDAMMNLAFRADFEELNKSITIAQAILGNADLYAPESIEGLEGQLESAKAVSENQDATQDEVDAARSALNAKSGAARLKAKKTRLRGAIFSARALSLGLYTDESVSVLTFAMDAAAVVEEDENATQEQVEVACDNLENAVEAMETRAVEKEPDNNAPDNNNTPDTNATINDQDSTDTTDTTDTRRSVVTNPRNGRTTTVNTRRSVETVAKAAGIDLTDALEKVDTPEGVNGLVANGLKDGAVENPTVTEQEKDVVLAQGLANPLANEENTASVWPGVVIAAIAVILVIAFIIYRRRQIKE